MAITSDRISAKKALSWGLVNEVTPPDQLMEIVYGWARTIATGPTVAYGLTKRAMNRGFNQSLTQSLDYESQLQELAGRTEDFKEGIQAFVEKREAVFEGR
jgi:2-(1,2-epoxy-1,2-dihydrophenyl)acetyl-CoA isomerase